MADQPAAALIAGGPTNGVRSYRHGPWRGLDEVEFATLGYVDWFNHRRLHGQITDDPLYTTPAAFETDHYGQSVTASEGATQ